MGAWAKLDYFGQDQTRFLTMGLRVYFSGSDGGLYLNVMNRIWNFTVYSTYITL